MRQDINSGIEVLTQDISGNSGQVTQRGNIYVCNGAERCPLHAGHIPPSAIAEADFYRLTGIRAGPRVQRMLEDFRERHNLTWRGVGVELMWRHRSLEYDDARECLRLVPSFTALVWGAVCAATCVFVLSMLTYLILSGHQQMQPSLIATALFAELTYLYGLWYSIRHMIAPEWVSRRLALNESRATSTKMDGELCSNA